VLLNWANGNSHFTLMPGITVPTGKYDVNDALNTGRDYWSFDLAGTYTWFDPKTGIDFSLTPGLMFNATNPATGYRTGDEFHVDWVLGKVLSERFGVGFAGYYYQQLESDSGPLIGPFTASSIQANGVGIGPAVLFNFKVAGKPVTIIGKALFDVEDRQGLTAISTCFRRRSS